MKPPFKQIKMPTVIGSAVVIVAALVLSVGGPKKAPNEPMRPMIDEEEVLLNYDFARVKELSEGWEERECDEIIASIDHFKTKSFVGLIGKRNLLDQLAQMDGCLSRGEFNERAGELSREFVIRSEEFGMSDPDEIAFLTELLGAPAIEGMMLRDIKAAPVDHSGMTHKPLRLE